MVKFVDQQLTQLRNEVYRMWTMVYNQMDQARQAVLGLDRNIAQQIWVRERLVDAQDIKIDTQVEDFIALYTPVAVDLRFVLAMLKIGDYGAESGCRSDRKTAAGKDVRCRAGDDERAAECSYG